MNGRNARMRTRLAIEADILKPYFPDANIQFPDDPARAGVVVPLRASRNRYVLWIPLGAFPFEPPEMYVVEPKPIRDCRGKKLADLGASWAMHLLAPDAHGHPQICHHNKDGWTPNIALYKVVMKGLIWLAAYELHKAKGKDIDHYLPHMEKQADSSVLGGIAALLRGIA